MIHTEEQAEKVLKQASMGMFYVCAQLGAVHQKRLKRLKRPSVTRVAGLGLVSGLNMILVLM